MAFNNRKDSTVSGSSIAAHLIWSESATGTINGINTVFTTANNVINSAIDVFLNGLLQQPGGGDYTFSGGNTVTFNVAPDSGSIILFDYIK